MNFLLKLWNSDNGSFSTMDFILKVKEVKVDKP